MEHHHFDQCVMILNSEGNNIFQVCTQLLAISAIDFYVHLHSRMCHNKIIYIPIQALSPEDFRYVMHVVESAILSTDLAMYFKKRDKFLDLIDNGEFDWQSDEKKDRKYCTRRMCC